MIKKTQTEPYLSTYFHARGRELGLPIAGNFELTARCNFRCPMCYVHMSEEQIRASGRELTAQQWLSIARQAQAQGMLFVLLTGGEPLLRKDFFEIYRGMKALGLMISINTNGSLLQGKILEQFLADPPFRFNISLYGGSDATYQTMCGVPAYDRVKESIRALRQAGVEVCVNLSITAQNRGDLDKIYADARELDVNVRASSYMYPPIRLEGAPGSDRRLPAQEAASASVQWDTLRFTHEEFRQRAMAMARLDPDIAGGCVAEPDTGIRCRAGSTSFWLTWDGRMLPCGMMPGPAAHPLDVGFAAAWEEIRSHTAAIRTPDKCRSCPHSSVCSVCAAACMAETGAFDRAPEYLCQYTKAVIRSTLEHADLQTGDTHGD